ncbi:hypothetical protein L596_008635 [Steinernema carpocapsae]|uniref:Calcineurin-like phosphoesterase domain-containing protein n=1 Tax=Steinernema carpocapsae TaxID=34508 RepID=A0A4U5PDW6_STECR|nr:hypothetical protein L596_008635 [Steinernema carpocapsae]
MILRSALFISTFFLIFGASRSLHRANTPYQRVFCTQSLCERPESEELRFFLLGDTGGIPIYPYTTYAQKKVAGLMNDLAQVNPVDFVLNVGDNIYFNGVSDVFDHRFEVDGLILTLNS